jgi:hypothetical protein
MHQVGPKDYGSQNFSFLAPKVEPVAVDEVQILRAATATARDRRIFRAHLKKNGLY